MAETAAAAYELASKLQRTRKDKVFRDSIKPFWILDRDQLGYQVQIGVDVYSYVLVDLKAGVSRPAFDHSKLAQALVNAGRKEVDASNLQLHFCEWKTPNLLRFRIFGLVYEVDLDTYELEKLGSTTGSTNYLDAIPAKGGDGGAESSITFVNQRDEAVIVFWLDHNGKRIFYRDLNAGSRAKQSSYEGHVWVVVDSHGTDICAFVVLAEPEEAVIQPVKETGLVVADQASLVGEEGVTTLETTLQGSEIEPLMPQEGQSIQNVAEEMVIQNHERQDQNGLDAEGDKMNEHEEFTKQEADMKHHKDPITNSKEQNGSCHDSDNLGKDGETKTQTAEEKTKASTRDWRAEIRDHNVILINRESSQTHMITHDGNPKCGYREILEWSPDGRYFVVTYVKDIEMRKITIVESSPTDQLQPKVHTKTYAKPGDELPTTKLALVDVKTRTATIIDDKLFPNPWSVQPALHWVEWKNDSSEFYFTYYQRGHKLMRLIAVDVTTNAARVVVEVKSDTFLFHDEKFYYELLTQTSELIWMSERSGWNHLYLFDSTTGEMKNQTTSGDWRVHSVDHMDEEERHIWFYACGVCEGQDPYYLHLCRVNLDGTNMTILTEGDGTHTIQWSPDRLYFIDTWSRVDKPATTELRHGNDGKLVCALEEAATDALTGTGWRAPIPFCAKGRDGTTNIYGVIQFPIHYNPGTLYPVLDFIYAGPHGYRTPKKFAAYHLFQTTAELGFIVVTIDGMGTSSRSKAFHDVCWQNLADAGLPDHKLFLKAAANKYPEIDVSRVGIFGTSAGGQNAMRALLDHGDFYKVAVSDCGCHDNRMDKMWWNEQWLGWPVDDEIYKRNSNVEHANRLPDDAKLLLVVGEMDTNVDPASTMQVVNALIKADKDFDMVVVPGGEHGSDRHPWVKRRIADFFMTHLQGRSLRRTTARDISN